MIRFELRVDQVVPVSVSLDADRPNQRAEIIYEGSDYAVGEVKPALRSCNGAFGHAIVDSTSPIDLDFAMRSDKMQKFQPTLTEGAELVEVYDPEIPDGAVT